MASTGHKAELYLVVAADGRPDAADRLRAALAAAEVSSILIVRSEGAAFDAATVKPLVDAAQKAGVAALLGGEAQLARTLKADGIHIPWSENAGEAYEEARDILGTRFIVGIDVGRSRHDAMSFGELGADYVAFGIPAHVEDRARAAERRLDLVTWWSEIFEVPCVAFDVDTPADVEALAAAGADFVAVTLPGDLASDAIAPWLAGIARSLGAKSEVA
jgi:thiamine-phosphate pyrophosphorylase